MSSFRDQSTIGRGLGVRFTDFFWALGGDFEENVRLMPYAWQRHMAHVDSVLRFGAHRRLREAPADQDHERAVERFMTKARLDDPILVQHVETEFPILTDAQLRWRRGREFEFSRNPLELL